MSLTQRKNPPEEKSKTASSDQDQDGAVPSVDQAFTGSNDQILVVLNQTTLGARNKAPGDKDRVFAENNIFASEHEEILDIRTQSRSLYNVSDTSRPAKVVVKLPLCVSQASLACRTSFQSNVGTDKDRHISKVNDSAFGHGPKLQSTRVPKKSFKGAQCGNINFSSHSQKLNVPITQLSKAKVKKLVAKMDQKVTPARGRGPVNYDPQPPLPCALGHTLDGVKELSNTYPLPLPQRQLAQVTSPRHTFRKSRKGQAKPTPPFPQASQHIQRRMNQGGPSVSHNQDALYRPDWQGWHEVAVRITGLPKDLHITTKDIWATFKSQGQISTIELGDSGLRDGTALVRFSPPPRDAFWASRTFRIVLSEASPVTFYCQIQLDPSRSRRQKLLPITLKSNVQYPHIITLIAETLDFGFMCQLTEMMTMCTVKTKESHRIVFQLNLHHKELEVSFAVAARDSRRRGREGQANDDLKILSFRYTIPLDQLTTIYETTSSGKVTWMLSIAFPPKFYWKGDEERSFPTSPEDRHAATFWNQRDAWYRRTDICYDRSGLRKFPLMLKKLNPIIDIGRWTTYRLCFSDEKSSLGPLSTMREALKEHNVNFEPLDGFTFVPKKEPVFWDYFQKLALKTSSVFNRVVVDESTLLEAQLKEEDTFPVRYQLEVCISQGYLNEHNLSRDFIDKLMAMDVRNAQEFLEHVANLGRRVYEPRKILESRVSVGTRPRSRIPAYCALVRSATVTPTMIYYNTPTVETSNRVIRQFAEHGDRFLRVRFTDEKNEGKVYSSDNDTNNEIFTRIKRAMAHGIIVGDRCFEFLAFGNSQFREHGAYFFARSPSFGPEHIRMWMGDFSDIRVVAKYAARLGQCFSTTRAINGTGAKLVEDDDIEDRTGHTFTDGVGKLSQDLAKFAAHELGLSETPSAYQFRLGGCKGVLTSWPEIGKEEIHIRPSQYKFAANHEGLEINRWSQFGGAFLNRQLISVLSALGVLDSIFVDRMTQQLSDLANAMTDSELAENLLQKAIDANQMTLALASMVIDGFQDAREPFTISILNLWRAWSTKYLKEKAKIFVQDGAFLLGCTDETRTLQGHFTHRQVSKSARYEEQLKALPKVFVQICRSEDDPPQVIIGPMSLARNPSLHPGDIRVVNGVDVPQLRHLINVVVLPQTGDRDLASMCSGGDLDGDDYIVMWDRALLPREWNEEPMDYSAPPPLKLGRDVGMDDIHSFFVEHMKMDNLGKIATAHLAISDSSQLGVKDKKCIQLARLHSMAVDYAKTGIPAKLPRELVPKQRPHFMEPKRKEPYHSRKILGQLYDQVEKIEFVPQYGAPFDKRILEAYKLDEQMLSDARDIKRQYDLAVRRVMAQHDIKTEFEVWSTFVLHHSNQNKDFKFHEEIGWLSTALKDQFRKACYLKAGSSEIDHVGPFAAAMYTVTSDEVQQAVEECHQYKIVDGRSVRVRQPTVDEMPLMSFPWIFQSVLGKVANGDFSMPQAVQAARKRMSRKTQVPSSLIDDTLQTAEGETHRGELLELFQHDGMSSVEKQRDCSRDEQLPVKSPIARFEEMAPSSSFKPHGQGKTTSSSSKTTWTDLEGLNFHRSVPTTPRSRLAIDEGLESLNVSRNPKDGNSQVENTSATIDAYDGLAEFEGLTSNNSIKKALASVAASADLSNKGTACRTSVNSFAKPTSTPSTPMYSESPRNVDTRNSLPSTSEAQSLDTRLFKEERNLVEISECSESSTTTKTVPSSLLDSALPPLTTQVPKIKSQDELLPLVPMMSGPDCVPARPGESYEVLGQRESRNADKSYIVDSIDKSMMTDHETRLKSKMGFSMKANSEGAYAQPLPLQNPLIDVETVSEAIRAEEPASTRIFPKPSDRRSAHVSAEGDLWEDLVSFDNKMGRASRRRDDAFTTDNTSSLSNPKDTFNSPLAGPSGHITSYSGSSDLIPGLSPTPAIQGNATGSPRPSHLDERDPMSKMPNEATRHERRPSHSSDSSGSEEEEEEDLQVTLDVVSGSSAWSKLEEMTKDYD